MRCPYCNDEDTQICSTGGYCSLSENHRLDADYWVYSGLLNSGNSYSATYLTEGMAWAKYLSSSQELWGVAGLSQGGEAAFLVSLQSDPVFAIISSGFSVYRTEAFRAQSDQIVIPGRFEHYDIATLRQIISAPCNRKKTLFFLPNRHKDTVWH